MILCAIRAGGGGERVRLATNGLPFESDSRLAAFMDKLMVCERSVEDIETMVQLMDRILTTVGLSLAEAKTFHMGIEWMETEGKRVRNVCKTSLFGACWCPAPPHTLRELHFIFDPKRVNKKSRATIGRRWPVGRPGPATELPCRAALIALHN